MEFADLYEKARQIRIESVKMISAAASGHPGGSLSEADILAYLYFQEMKIDPCNPAWEQRDRFVLSKGHGAPGLYAALALRGYFPVEELATLRKLHSRLQGHPDMKKLPGVDFSTGSLGQGFSAACGMAMAGKLDKADWRVYTIIGDGEMQEGQIWEAAMSAVHYKLDNITAFIDYNGLQIDGRNDDVICLGDVCAKWTAFGWNVILVDGHKMEKIADAVAMAKTCKGRPTVIVASTIKGKGVSFMEDAVGWHGSAPNAEQTQQALSDLVCQEVR